MRGDRDSPTPTGPSRRRLFLVLYREDPGYSSGTVDVAFLRAKDKDEATELAVKARSKHIHALDRERHAAEVRRRLEVLGEGEFGQVVHLPTTYSDY